MKEIMIVGRNTYTREEKARAILFGNALPEDFRYSFTFHGIELFVKVRQEEIMTFYYVEDYCDFDY